jgi:ABC-2 type transport system permease protein
MNKIFYIIQREYITRVSKKTFWILTFLIPLLYLGLIGMSVYVNTETGNQLQTVYVLDQSNIFDTLKSTETVTFVYPAKTDEKELERTVLDNEKCHILKIPNLNIDDPQGFSLISSRKNNGRVLSTIKSVLSERVRDIRIHKLGLENSIIEKLDPKIVINTTKLSQEGYERDNSVIASAVAFISGFLNYLFILLYGSLVLRGVQEEKSNRIVEIIVSSVRPFELMFGKIVGVALVGLTQFFLWIFFIAALTMAAINMPGHFSAGGADDGFSQVIASLSHFNFTFILAVFLFYFVFGYLLYSSMFASIAAAVDNQADVQQFMLPISIPLIISFVFVQPVIDAPQSALAIWLSIIPFSSPMIMMARISFDVPLWQLIVSMLSLILTFIFTTWICAKIYRVGILTYGGKVSYKDMYKWIFYK